MRAEIVTALLNEKVTAIVRGIPADQVCAVAEALLAGGVRCIEVTFNTPGAAEMIRALKAGYGNKMLIGAGTVLDTETCKTAIDAGADFILSPALNTAVITMCNRYGKVAVPGVMTPTEILTAMEGSQDLAGSLLEEIAHHHHEHDEHCDCGCHDHDHHHHHADEVFTSWGVETTKKFTKEQILAAKIYEEVYCADSLKASKLNNKQAYIRVTVRNKNKMYEGVAKITLGKKTATMQIYTSKYVNGKTTYKKQKIKKGQTYTLGYASNDWTKGKKVKAKYAMQKTKQILLKERQSVNVHKWNHH